jgi:hypothetical protein
MITLCFSSIGVPTAEAFTPQQRKEIELRTFYDATDINLCTQAGSAAGSDSSTTPATNTSTGDKGKVYMIGDSITEGTQTQLTTALKEKKYSDVVINGKSSRRLSVGNTILDGVSVFKNDKAQWSDASTIIIELGTNGGVSGANINTVVELAKTSKAKLYWVNIGVDNSKRNGADIDTGPINKLLSEAASKGGFSIIDWASAVKKNPDYIDPNPATGLGVHPFTATGRPGFASVVANGISGALASIGAGVTAAGDSADCNAATVVSDTTLSGNTNAEIIWNFLGCKGLSANQVAGIMGNMQAESHFEPKLVEYGYQNSRGEISQAGKPSSLDEDVPPDRNSKGQPGYGIVQWTFPSRKQGLRDMAKAQGKKGGDLGVQLDYLWLELSRGFITKLQATTSIEAATRLVLIDFERPKNPDRTMPVRLGFAQSILRQTWAKDGGTGCASK